MRAAVVVRGLWQLMQRGCPPTSFSHLGPPTPGLHYILQQRSRSWCLHHLHLASASPFVFRVALPYLNFSLPPSMAQATIAAATALATGTLTSHLNRPHAASDSRLLSNLIKAERNHISDLRSTVSSALAASSALSAWGTSEAPDINDTSTGLATLLSACSDVQSTHIAAIETYRAALKAVVDRETSMRSIVRDRDILVSRLIKASNKNASETSKKSPEERAEKVETAQRELQACEEVLASEEAALVGVKRRTFKEALTMRMKTMGDAGAAMVDAAQEAILLLDAFDSNAYQMPDNGTSDDQMPMIDGQERRPYHQQPHPADESSEERMAAMSPNSENSSS